MVSFDEEALKKERQMEYQRREMQRKSLDTIRLYNPLDFDFKYMFDGFTHKVPAKGTKDEPRYLARHYFKKIAEHMIGQQALLKGSELKALREKQLGHSYLDKYEENQEIWNRVPKLDDPDLLKAIREQVILGVVEEYGMNVEPEQTQEMAKPRDLRPLTDQIFEGDERRVDDNVTTPVKSVNKEELAKEILE